METRDCFNNQSGNAQFILEIRSYNEQRISKKYHKSYRK